MDGSACEIGGRLREHKVRLGCVCVVHEQLHDVAVAMVRIGQVVSSRGRIAR
jgi:hypothetical protein